MRATQIFFRNLMLILKSRELTLSWIEEKTGVSAVFLSTFEWIAAGLSFQIVIKVAMALGVSIRSLISEYDVMEITSYENMIPKEDYLSLYRHFWTAVDYEANKQDKDLYDLAWCAGKTIAGLISCATRDKDIDVQRAEAIALLLDTTIDDLVWEKIPEYPYEEENFDELLVANF